jgi:hypothetical protein
MTTLSLNAQYIIIFIALLIILKDIIQMIYDWRCNRAIKRYLAKADIRRRLNDARLLEGQDIIDLTNAKDPDHFE